jgi:hypothetical protein
MKILQAALILFLAMPAWAETSRVQVIQPTSVTAPKPTPVTDGSGPATDTEILQLIDALGVRASLMQSVESSGPIVKQSFNDLINQAAKEKGVSLPAETVTQLSTRVSEKYNRLKNAMYDWMIQQYIARHKAAYTQAETRQIISFMQSPVGQKYVANDSKIWGNLLAEANTQFAQLVPSTVLQVFREAGAVR